MLTTAEKAPLLDQDGNPLSPSEATAVGTNDFIFTVDTSGDAIYVVGKGAGTATLHATRTSDNVNASLEVVVDAEPFTISLGTPEPK